jgi:hypothetical protein
MSGVLFLIDFTNGNMILGFVPESLALMLSGVGLIGATLIMRRVFKRHDRGKIAETSIDNNKRF